MYWSDDRPPGGQSTTVSGRVDASQGPTSEACGRRSALTRADFATALKRHGLSAAHVDEWFGDPDNSGYRIFEIEIGNGRWLENEIVQGVTVGGWAGDFVPASGDTVVATDDSLHCAVTYGVGRDGGTLSVRVAHDACPDPDDLSIQTVIYESSTFRLVQAADWTPPTPAPQPPVSPSDGPPTSQASTASTRQTVHPIGTVKGAPLGYFEYLPPDYGTQPSPLLVFLHGSGESGAGDEESLAKLTATGIPSFIASNKWPDARPFVVLAPQHKEDPPSYCMEAKEIDAFLRFAMAHYDVDPKRIYLTGLSCGAIGLWNYLAVHSDELVAAAVPIAGYGIGPVEFAGCNIARVPIWAFHGSADENVPVRGDVYPVTTLQACTDPPPVDARVKVYVGEHHDVWNETYDPPPYDIYAWMLSHHK